MICSLGMESWFSDANIQEGLMVSLLLNLSILTFFLHSLQSCLFCTVTVTVISSLVGTFTSHTCYIRKQGALELTYLFIFEGSDHCPVYAVLKPLVSIPNPNASGEKMETHLLDILNPPGMFIRGLEQPSFQVSKAYQMPKLSGRLLSEFVARRSIKDMFSSRRTAPPESVLVLRSTHGESSSSHDIVAPALCDKAKDAPRIPADRYTLHSCTTPSCLGVLGSSHTNTSIENIIAKRGPSPMLIAPHIVSTEGAQTNKRRKLSPPLAPPGAKGMGKHKHQSKLSGFFMPQPGVREVQDSYRHGGAINPCSLDQDKCLDMGDEEEEEGQEGEGDNAEPPEDGDSSGEREGT